MSGIFPDNGVPPQQATNSVTPTPAQLADECEALFFRDNCKPRFNTAWANSMISELFNLSQICGDFEWDCNRNDNLAARFVDLLDQNRTTTLRQEGPVLPLSTTPPDATLLTGFNSWQVDVDFGSFALPEPPSCFCWMGDVDFAATAFNSFLNNTDGNRVRFVGVNRVNGSVGTIEPMTTENFLPAQEQINFQISNSRSGIFPLNAGANTFTTQLVFGIDAPETSERVDLNTISTVQIRAFLVRK